MQRGSANLQDELHAALLEYHRKGGGLTDARPRLALARVTEVLQIASGRLPEGPAGTRAPCGLEDAARFFICSALLRPGADHYALLGLERSADTAAIKEHYRLMMRLLHPDFAATAPTPWPVDAAARVNLAYEVLSAPAQRHAYDEKLAPPAPPRTARPPSRGIAIRATPSAGHPRRRLKQLALLFGGLGALAGLIGLLAGGPVESLVQRPGAASAAAAIANAPLAEAVTQREAGVPSAALVAPSVSAARGSSTPASPAASAPKMRTDLPAAPAWTPASAPAPASAPQAIVAAAAPSEPEPAIPPGPPPAALPNAQPTPTPTPSAAGPTLAEVHPVFSVLLQQIESGWGDRVLGMLDRPARSAPAAQVLLARYNAIVEDRRPLRLSGIAFSSQARSGHLLMTGRVLIAPRDERQGLPPGELALEAEFASRDGRVVITRLAPASE